MKRVRMVSLLLIGTTNLQMPAAQPLQAADSHQHLLAAFPNPLQLEDGRTVRTAKEFMALRRPQILRLFSEDVYGKTPDQSLRVEITDEGEQPAFHGLATRHQMTLSFGSDRKVKTHLLVYYPANRKHPVGVFVGLDFDGNQSVSDDPGIDLNPVWTPDPNLDHVRLANELKGHVLKIASANTRGSAAQQWQVEKIVGHGFAIAVACGGDFEPDFVAGIGYGVRPLFFAPAQRLPGADDWGALGVWAWGMSRIVDYLEQDPAIDHSRTIAFGHSRYGKAALWAAAQDNRFAAVISNESGQGGATLSHRGVGESPDHMTLAFPYWFCANYHKYLGNTSSIPVDGHLLLSLIAPRPLYVASALADPFSDPEGEFLAARAVTPVYKLFGVNGIDEAARPPANKPVGDTVRYHVRTGGHDVTAYDWDQYLKFAEKLPSTPANDKLKTKTDGSPKGNA